MWSYDLNKTITGVFCKLIPMEYLGNVVVSLDASFPKAAELVKYFQTEEVKYPDCTFYDLI